MTPTPVEKGSSETKDVDFSFITINYQGKSLEVAWPSAAAKAAGVVACKNGHPCIPDATTGTISCGCGSKEKQEE